VIETVEINKRLENLEVRVTRLEEKVKFIEQFSEIKKAKPLVKGFEGLVGGISKLFLEGYFDKPRLVSEVKSELERIGYYYNLSSISKLLYVDFMKKRNLLTRIGKRGEWRYVRRK